MSLWKKIGGAFVEMPDSPEAKSEGGGVSDAEIDALLRASGVEELAGKPGTKAPSAAPAPAAKPKTALDWTLTEVFQAGGIQGGRNSAETVLVLLHGLAAIPEDQRLIAIRAMDAADEGWDEETVLTDATKRLQVLQHFGTHIDKDEQARIASVNQAAATEQAALQGQVTELDAQIATLQKQREDALASIAASKAHAEDGAKAVRERANSVRDRVKTEAAKYKGLLAFFGRVAV